MPSEFRVSFFRDKAASLLRGATFQTHFSPVNTNKRVEDGVRNEQTAVDSDFVSVDLLPCFKSEFFQLFGFKGSDPPSVCPKSSRDEEGEGSAFSNDVAMFMKVQGIELASFAQKVAVMLSWLLVLVGIMLVILPRFGSLDLSSSMTNQRKKYGKMKRYGRGLHIKMMASLFFLGSIATALDTDGSNVGMQNKDKSSKNVSLSESMKRLDEVSKRQLRGAGSRDTDPTATFLEVTDVLESELENIKVVQKQMQSGDGAVVAAAIGDAQVVAQALSNHQEHDEDFTALNLSLTEHEAMELQEMAQTATPKELALIAKQFDFTEAIDYFEQAISVMKTAKASIVALSPPSRVNHQSHRRGVGTEFNFKEGSSSSRFFKRTGSTFNIPNHRNFVSGSSSKHGKRHFTFPKLRYAEKLRKQQETEHGQSRRRLSEDHPKCMERCEAKEDESDRFLCECERLFDCAGKLTPYDFAIMNLGKFVDDDKSSENFANFTVDDMADINVFDARDEMLEKMRRVEIGVTGEVTRDNCFAVLYELHTACNPNQDETCTEPNTRSFTLSTDQVCDAVNTQTKLKVQPIGEYYDFQNWAVPQGSAYKKVFTTSQTYNGDLGGVSGADAKCQARANAANLGGIYRAWITDSTSNSPSNRFERDDYLDSLPYYLVDGVTRVADNWGSLTKTLQHSMNVDENGRGTGGGRVWSNTWRGGGRRGNYHCNDWSSSDGSPFGRRGYFGDMAQVGSGWTNTDETWCNNRYRLYCFQQDVSETTELESEMVHWSTELAVRCCSDEDRGNDSNWMRQSSSCPYVLKQENEEECQYLSFHHAEDFCAEEGGRLCTKDEVEKECANGSGCPFASQLVWSSTEAEPQCPATSIDTCGGVVKAFEKLYQGRPVQFLEENNPMKEDRDQVIDNEHWLRCVRYNGQNCLNPNKAPSLASNEEVHPIVCCSDTSNTDPWTKAPSNVSPSPPSWCPYRLGVQSALIPETDRCNSGTFDEAVAYCDKYGGRLCSSEEFENNCVADPGCGWSYDEVAWANDFTFSNVDFPVGFSLTFPQQNGVEHGEETINGYIYAEGLSRTGDSFCGSTLGPPTALAKACDDSIDFLLGPYMSAGELNSIADAVNEVNDWVVESIDIGSNVDGSTSYTDGTWVLKGSGFISQSSDSLHYSYIPAYGEYVDTKILVQDFTGTQDNARVGLMIRESLEPDSRHYFTLLNGHDRVRGLYRTSGTGGGSSLFNGQSPVFQGPVWLRTIKNGNRMTSYYKRGSLAVRKVRITRPNTSNPLHMREVEVIDMNGDNVALRKPAKQSSTLGFWGPESGNDENLNNLMQTQWEGGAYWEVDLESDIEIMEVKIYNGGNLARLSDSVVSLRGSDDTVIAEYNLGPDVSWEQFTIKSEDFSWDIDWIQVGGAINVNVGDKFYVGIAIGARANDVLTATDFAVNAVVVSGADEQLGMLNSPRWLTWYTRQKDTALIESVNEWTNWYQNIANDKDEPSWLDWYTNIRQDNGDRFILPGSGPFYCEDTSISEDGESIRNCQELWLNYKTGNPYTSRYMSISYPDDPDLLPFNETSCDEYQTCQEDWVKEGPSAQNPFDRNTGCYHFWFYCRELEPETVQCSRFFDDCSDKLEMEYPNWQYPQPACIDTTIQADVIDTCPMEWLKDKDDPNPYTVETNEACYSFWETCRSDLNKTYPEWDYPISYCEDDPNLTCQEEWLDQYKGGESNPFESDSRCYNFWNSCYENLRLEFPRWSEGWPLPDPPTTDDFMPGYCCLDTPANDDHFGYNYDPEQGMKCQKRGPWFTGLSSESCSHANGHWFPTPCITLQRCIDARPLPDDPFFNLQFEEWVEAEEIEIYDASDQEQCEQARIALGYESDYRNDYHICETFDEFMCDPFFDDLEFLADGASNGAPTEFGQIEFVPTTFPDDDPLKFDSLPKGETMEGMTPSNKAHLSALKWSKFSLYTWKENTKDYLKDVKFKCDAIPGGWLAPTWPLGFNWAYFACILKVFVWFIVYWGVKIAYVGVSIAYYDNAIGPYAELDGYEYSKATYYNVKSSFKWNVEALDTINNNMYEQHHQMRAELQDRHTDIQNNVNEYTTCMSNYLGVQFFAAFYDTSVAPLSTRCNRVLSIDSNGRRLSDGSPLFELDVKWGVGSIQGLVKEAVEVDKKLLEKDNEILEKEIKIQNTLNTMMDSMNSIMMKLDMDTNTKSKKSKKAKGEKEAAQEDATQDTDLFTRNLLDVKEAVNVKFDRMERQVKSIDVKVGSMEGKVIKIEDIKDMESKIESMEGKVESIEGKVESIEKTIEELKDMLSQLMMRGTDVA